MERHEDGAVKTSVETEATISHFIPSVELTGSRSEKLRKLDTLIRYLEQLRRSLAADAVSGAVMSEGNTRSTRTPSWGWFCAGVVAGAALALLLITAGRWAL